MLLNKYERVTSYKPYQRISVASGSENMLLQGYKLKNDICSTKFGVQSALYLSRCKYLTGAQRSWIFTCCGLNDFVGSIAVTIGCYWLFYGTFTFLRYLSFYYKFIEVLHNSNFFIDIYIYVLKVY